MIVPKYGTIPFMVDALTKKLAARDARDLKKKIAQGKTDKVTPSEKD